MICNNERLPTVTQDDNVVAVRMDIIKDNRPLRSRFPCLCNNILPKARTFISGMMGHVGISIPGVSDDRSILQALDRDYL